MSESDLSMLAVVCRQNRKPLLANAGLRSIRFHDLRHTCATLMPGALGRRIEVTSASTQDVPLFPIIDTTYYAFPGWKERFLIADVAEETVIIGVSAPADQFDEWLPTAKKTLDTVKWQGV